MMDAGTRVFMRDVEEKVILEKHREFKQKTYKTKSVSQCKGKCI